MNIPNQPCHINEINGKKRICESVIQEFTRNLIRNFLIVMNVPKFYSVKSAVTTHTKIHPRNSFHTYKNSFKEYNYENYNIFCIETQFLRHKKIHLKKY